MGAAMRTPEAVPGPAAREQVGDAELVARCRKGSPEAFDVLVVRHQDRIYNAVLRQCGDAHEAADITQRAFFNAFRSIGEFKGDCAFSTWMYRIAFNQGVSHRRENARHRALSLDAAGKERPAEPVARDGERDRLEGEEEREIVRRSLQELDEGDRRIIVLKDVEGCSYDEIASVLQIPKGTVRSRLHRARLVLRDILKGYLGTPRREGASKGRT